MTVAHLERNYPMKVYKKCRNVGKRLHNLEFALIFIEVSPEYHEVTLIYQRISFSVLIFS